jgi:hypothetical protein
MFGDNSNLDSILSLNLERNTMFLAWMEANRVYPLGSSLTYSQFLSLFTYDSDSRSWHPRRTGHSIGRLTFVAPSTRELYYMRLLLNIQVGCKSFEDVRTVGGIVFDSYREACSALGLLGNDLEFMDAIDELAILCSGLYLRIVFAMLLLGGSMGDPLNVWEKNGLFLLMAYCIIDGAL